MDILDETKRLAELEKKYGEHFRRKLALYQTATLNGEPVRLIYCSTISLAAIIQDLRGKIVHCRVIDLDDFVL